MSDDTLSSWCWMQVSSGHAFDLLTAPVPQINIRDIAHSLAGINRFNGHTKSRYVSVAEHSVRVARILAHDVGGHADNATTLLYALLHDAHEAYTGDMTKPMQDTLAYLMPEFKNVWKAVQHRIQCQIHLALDLPVLPHVDQAQAIQIADMKALDWERRHFMAPSERQWPILPSCEDYSDIVNLNCLNSRVMFLEAYRHLQITRERAHRV